MAQPSTAEQSDPDDRLGAASTRLERALALLETQVAALSGRAEGGNGGLFDFDRSQLASELDAAKARERELEAAGSEASQALGRAIDGIRRALDHVEEA